MDRTKGETAIVLFGAGEAGEEGRIWTGLEANIVVCMCVVERGKGNWEGCGEEWGRGSGRLKGRERKVGQRKVGVLFAKKEINKRVGRFVLGREEAKEQGRITKGMGCLYG